MIVYSSVNSGGPDEMPHFAAFHLGLQCLPKCPVRVSSIRKVKRPKSKSLKLH